MIKRTISGMIGKGSLAHNRREFFAENVEPDRVQLNICYRNENLKEVYKELFDEAVERYNVCLLYTSPSPRDRSLSRMPSSA